ncbi:uncharacterized protein KY384_002975 [Bacidia gigantensis]|uniref:uncharacterized protein n=1 Tax=Bacidia gigantensis TaxID=2732470 RepID=UPI001D04B0BE|nr:uncharacterized protein KY384_002975 [Bacidia gigantensis]KAG8531346.1 hypothetical protein KY384_002975 [Bacidia gigantensis]
MAMSKGLLSRELIGGNWFLVKRPANINIKSFKRQKHSFETTAGYLHIIIPAGDPNPNFCRTALSAALLNQPHPYVANWGGQFNDNRYGEEGKWEWGNLAGTLQYLKDLPPARADDLVLVIDHEDTWFQLQPELLIKRYRDVIRLSQRQLRGRLGNAAEEGLKQKIVFAAQKTCPNNNENHISCYAPPNLHHLLAPTVTPLPSTRMAYKIPAPVTSTQA